MRIKNIIRAIYGFFLTLVYEESRSKIPTTKLDSRTIPPLNKGNHTERVVCKATLNDTAILSYSIPEVHSSIYWFKYKRDKYTIKFLSGILLDEILALISDKLDGRHNITEWIVTFAPSTTFHRGDKKWDHNQDLFQEMKKNSSFSFQKIFGVLDKEVKSNKKLSREERQNISANKFTLLPTAKISPNSGLIIFDDVTTTGSTLKSLENLAKKLEPKIILTVAIAH